MGEKRRDLLREYYQSERTFLRESGAEFAQNNPGLASRLSLEGRQGTTDPDVELLIEAFAFLTARIRLKLDDEFPEIVESLLNVLYPHYLAPIPSLSIAQFTPESVQGKLTGGHLVKAETPLESDRFEGGKLCRFRTCYPVTLWPVQVQSASLISLEPRVTDGRPVAALLTLSLRCLNNTKFATLGLGEKGREQRPFDGLRFYLNGEASLTYPLYEMLFNNVERVELRAGPAAGGRGEAATIRLPNSSIKPVGFEANESLLPYSVRSFRGYRLLTEFFAFPEKFLFFDIEGLGRASAADGSGDRLDLVIHLRGVTLPNAVVDANTFRLGCTPVVNLFERSTEGIRLSDRRAEYKIVPDRDYQAETEIYSINSVSTFDPAQRRERHFQPFYSYKHARDAGDEGIFWYATRRPTYREEYEEGQNNRSEYDGADDSASLGTDIFLSLVDLNFNPHKLAGGEVIDVQALCTDRDLPSGSPLGTGGTHFHVEGVPTLAQVRCLKKPTRSSRPPLLHAAQWRLISHLSLNHLSLGGDGGEKSAEPLREILTLYKFINSPAIREQIVGIESVKSVPAYHRFGEGVGAGFVRGVEVTIRFDEDRYAGSSVFLFASVLERFLGLYVSVNSFSRLVAETRQSERRFDRWTPRAGEQPLL